MRYGGAENVSGSDVRASNFSLTSGKSIFQPNETDVNDEKNKEKINGMTPNFYNYELAFKFGDPSQTKESGFSA